MDETWNDSAPSAADRWSVDFDDIAYEVGEITFRAALHFRVDDVPFTDNPSDYSGEYEHMLEDAALEAVTAAGYDVGSEDVRTEIYETLRAAEDQHAVGQEASDGFMRIGPGGELWFHPSAVASPRRDCKRRSRGRSVRRRGSRRVTASARGPDEPEPEPPGFAPWRPKYLRAVPAVAS